MPRPERPRDSRPARGGQRRQALVAAAIGLFLAALAAEARAESGTAAPKAQLNQVQKAIQQHQSKRQALTDQAAALARDIGQIRAKTVRLASQITASEAAVYLAGRRVQRLAAAERDARARLKSRRHELGQILTALARLARIPSDALLVSPEGAAHTYRASLLLRALIPELHRRADRLAAEIAEFSALKAESARQQADLLAERNRLGESRNNLRQLLAAKAAAERRTVAERTRENRRLEQLAAKATSLQTLIEKITAEEKRERELNRPGAAEAAAAAAATKAAEARLAALPAPAAPQPGGWLRQPAEGRVVARFGAKNALGVIAKGVTIATVPDALVVAPRAGRVMFAGPFRGYGLLLIIKQAEGYHLLMAGFARIDASVGQWLVAGEPVGQMGGNGNGKSRLYVELRHNDSSVDPVPWLIASKRKVSG